MQYISSEKLHPGVRIVKPIYSKDGVLLCNANSQLSNLSIRNIQQSASEGIYVYELNEPIMYIPEEDIAFEQAQTVYLYQIKDLYEKIYKQESWDTLDHLVAEFHKHYGKKTTHRINYNQNLRTSNDFMYKHAISVAVLSTLMGQYIQLSADDYKSLIAASLLYGFGHRFLVKKDRTNNTTTLEFDEATLQSALEKGVIYLNATTPQIPYLQKAVHIAEHYIFSKNPERSKEHSSEEVLLLSEILKTAIEFDWLTGLMINEKPKSELLAINNLLERPAEFNKTIVSVLVHSIHIVPVGANVILNTGDKATVLVVNEKNYKQPIILHLKEDKIYNLNDPAVHQHIQIVDIIKTMDNRIELNPNTEEYLKNL